MAGLRAAVLATTILWAGSGLPGQAKPAPPATFFVTSTKSLTGGNLGGLAGADRTCRRLAKAAHLPHHKWRAYLSAIDATGRTIDARDRIGQGPWVNARGELIAATLQDLHGPANGISRTTALNERGESVFGPGEPSSQHDILTGSTAEGRLAPPVNGQDLTCRNWTSNTTDRAMVGHMDRQGYGADPTSWNAAHKSRGCSVAELSTSGGDGRFYCFAAD